jgi:hypothetical protein
MRRFHAVLLALALALPVAAAELPAPLASHYPDRDSQAQVRVAQLEEDTRFRQLQRQAKRGHLSSGGLAALACGYTLRGDVEQAKANLERARTYAGRRTAQLRHVLWSAGWSELNLGNYGAAADAWSESARLHGGQPFWLPYSMAVLAELDGQRDLAVRWYAAAVRSQARWGHAEGVARSTWHWQRKESSAMDRVFNAWQASEQGKTAAPATVLESEAG